MIQESIEVKCPHCGRDWRIQLEGSTLTQLCEPVLKQCLAEAGSCGYSFVVYPTMKITTSVHKVKVAAEDKND